MTVISKGWNRLTLPGKVVFTAVPLLLALTIPLIVVGPHVKPNFASGVLYSHSSLVKTMELILQLPVLTTVTHANSFRNFFETGFFP